MHEAIYVRDNKIAFPTVLNDGEAMVHRFDLSACFVEGGLFFPLNDRGLQALQHMAKTQPRVLRNVDGSIGDTNGDMGVMMAYRRVSDKPVVVIPVMYRVRVNTKGYITSEPIALGNRGSFIASIYEGYRETLMMCDYLSKSFDEALAMYCKHTGVPDSHYGVMSFDEIKNFFNTRYPKELLAKLEK